MKTLLLGAALAAVPAPHAEAAGAPTTHQWWVIDYTWFYGSPKVNEDEREECQNTANYPAPAEPFPQHDGARSPAEFAERTLGEINDKGDEVEVTAHAWWPMPDGTKRSYYRTMQACLKALAEENARIQKRKRDEEEHARSLDPYR
jgi:hypothetical protein